MKILAVFSLVHRDLDNFENGCSIENGKTDFIDIRIAADSVAELVAEVCKRFNVESDSVLLNSCEEIGRIDVQTLTKTERGLQCQHKRFAEGFKAGNFDMWLNNICGYVETVPERIDLVKALESVA